MPKNSTPSTNLKWTGMVPIDDTALAVTDTGGPGMQVAVPGAGLGVKKRRQPVGLELFPRIPLLPGQYRTAG